MSTENETLRNWWTESQSIKHLMEVTTDLQNMYGNDRVVAVGASFAWAAYALGRQREAMGLDPNVSILPFSGGFYEPTKTMDVFLADNPIEFDEPDAQFITEFREAVFPFPCDESIADFRRQLTKAGLSPADIIDRHRESGERTVFIDSVLMGRGLISFYSVMHKWAEEQGRLDQLSNAVHFHAYDRIGAFNPQYFQSIEGITNIKLPMSSHALTEAQERHLGGMISDNRMGPDSSRMTPYYDICKHSFGKTPVFPGNENVWNAVRDSIDAFI